MDEPDKIRSMFDQIAPTYDLLNHLMSFGMDIGWRRRAVSFLAEKRGGRILDLAAGSGDVSLEILRRVGGHIVGADFSLNMLEKFREKLAGRDSGELVDLVACDALALPYRKDTFDASIVAFGIRNFSDRLHSLREMYRVVKPGGISIILELSKPKNRLVAPLYEMYAGRILPRLGKAISHHNGAYHYLPESIIKFPEPGEFCALMEKAGFAEITVRPLTFGTAMIYCGRKAPGGSV